MLKAYIFLILWLIVACNCRSLETRARISTNNEDEHVHIKVLMPKVLHKYKLPRHTIRPHYAKRLPTHYEAISRPNFPQQSATINQGIFSQHHEHDDFELPAAAAAPPPMQILTTEHKILAHMAETAPLADNDISHNYNNNNIRLIQRQKRKRTPNIMPPPTALPSPMMTQHSYGRTTPDVFSSTLLDDNVLTADDFLRDVQQLYVQKYGATMTPTLMMKPQMQALTKTTTSKPITTTTTTIISKKQKKKRKHNKNYNKKFHFSKPANSQQYYTKEEQENHSNLQKGFQPYSSNQAYSNYYNYNDDNYFDSKNSKFNIIDHTPMGANEFSTDDTTDDHGDDDDDDIDANSSSTEDYTADSVSDTVMTFSAPIQPEEPTFTSSSTLSSSSSLLPYFMGNGNIETNNNNYYNTNISDYDNDDNDDDGGNGGFHPISYQDMYATYTAIPVAHHLSTMPTRLKYKRQQKQQQRQQGQPLREQFVQLSSIAPVVSNGINTQSAPTTTIVGDIGTIYGGTQQPSLQRYKNRKNRHKVKRNRLMVQ